MFLQESNFRKGTAVATIVHQSLFSWTDLDRSCDLDRFAIVLDAITDEPVVLEGDSTRRTYLHPVAGSEAARIEAGLFAKPFA